MSFTQTKAYPKPIPKGNTVMLVSYENPLETNTWCVSHTLECRRAFYLNMYVFCIVDPTPYLFGLVHEFL